MSPILDMCLPVPVGMDADRTKLGISIAVMEPMEAMEYDSAKFLGVLDTAIRVREEGLLTRFCHASRGVQVGVRKSRGATEERQNNVME